MKTTDTLSSGTPKGFPWDFFAAVNDGDESLAKDHHRDASLLPDGQPSPRMQELVEEGAWDSQVVVGLCFLEEGCCAGSVGTSESRFCGKTVCTIAAHKKALRDVTTGWYISAGSKSQGYYWSPCLPTFEDGGPITSNGAAFLSMDTNFRMSRGQWQLALEAWHQWNALGTPVSATTVDTTAGVPPLDPFAGLTVKQDPSVRMRLAPIQTAFTSQPSPPDLIGGAADGFGFGAAEEAELTAGDPFNVRLTSAAIRASPRGPAPSALTDLAYEQRSQARTIVEMREHMEVVLMELAKTRETSEMLRHSMSHERTAMQTTIQRLSDRVVTLEASPAALEQFREAVEKCATALFSTQGVVPKLVDQFRNFRERIEAGGGIECHGVRFSSGKEVMVWWEAKGLENSAIFVDSIALLHGISASYVSRTEAGKRLETQGKNQQSNDLEEIIVSSFQTHLPSVFAGGRTSVENTTAPAVLKKTMKSYQEWRPKGEMFPGVATEITDGVKELATQVRVYRNEVTTDSAVRDLASGLLEDARQFCNDLVSFIDRQNDALTHNSSYNAEQIWEMQLECLRKILMELSAARREVIMAARHQPALYLWGMLKAWQIQQRYLKNHFKDDPALTGIMVRRIVMQSGSDGSKDKLSKLQEQVAEHFRAHSQSIKELKAAIAKVKP